MMLASALGSRCSTASSRLAPRPARAALAAAPKRRRLAPAPRAAAAAASASSTADEQQRQGPAAGGANRFMLSCGLVDYYEVLGVHDDAPAEEVKRAYRALAKECHPDYLGDRGHDICILLNEAYEVLSDDGARAAYNARLETALADEDDAYTGEPLSKWTPACSPSMAKNEDPAENRGVFVDENTCIGCKQCVWHAPACFRIEPDYGRSRVFAQWLNTEDDIQAAIDSCPVSCIHWVSRQDLPALEFVMQNRVDRVNVGVMMAGQGQVADVFDATASFLKERRRREEAQARAKRAYSPAQEEARRRASEELLKEHMGFFAQFFKVAVETVASTVEGTGRDLRVGRRRRATHWTERDASSSSRRRGLQGGGGDGYFLVPPERALVPIAVYQQQEP